MCHHNFVQHNGCGHIGESHSAPWTLCASALARLSALRGPNSPPLSPAAGAPPKRTPSTRRFLSLSRTLSRSASGAGARPVQVASSRSSMMSGAGSVGEEYFGAPEMEIDTASVPAHQVQAVKCAAPTKRTRVSSEMKVCKECARWIADMRSLVQRFDKTGSVKGTAAFEAFLKGRGEGGGEDAGDLTVPVDEDEGGVFGARQAIILGHPEEAIGMPRGLGTWRD
jgi:hypothetical protein